MANVNYATSSSQKVAVLWNGSQAFCDEGSYFVSTNPTPGTVIATTTSVVDDAATASATHAQNVPVMHIQNKGAISAPSPGLTIYPQYLRMMLSQVPSSATTWRFALRGDQTARYTSGGSTIVPQNTNIGSGNTSVAAVYFGAVVTALGSGNMRLLANGTVGSVIPVTLDVWTFTFGDIVQPSNFLNGSASAKNVVIALPPIAIPPGCNLNFEMWGAGNAAAPSWEFEMGHVERVSGQ